MRRRILWVSLASVALAVVVLGVPLGVTVSRVVGDDERSELQRTALHAALAVSPGYVSGDPIELPQLTKNGMVLGVYDPQGKRVSGSGPAVLERDLAAAVSGRVAGADSREQVVQAVPVTAGESVIAVVRAASPESTLRARVLVWLAGLAGLCVVAALFAGGLAVWGSRRLAAPLTRLRRAAENLGGGDFTVRAEPSGVAEIDAVGDSLNRTAGRLASLLERERQFSERASHQLRTPLTQLHLELESGLEHGGAALRSAAESARDSADQLSQTIDDVLALARSDDNGPGFSVEDLLEQCRRQWQGPLAAASRPLRVVVERGLWADASLASCRQILHVLLDNALQHGQGTVTLHARGSHGAVAIDVADEGSAAPISLQGNGRMGLSLASSLARAGQGRLLVDQRGGGTRFTVLVPRRDRSPGG